MPLKPGAVEYFTKEAKRTLDAFAFGGDPYSVPEIQKAEATFQVAIRHVIETYCALPEHAGSEVQGLLLNLPSKDNPLEDAILGMEILKQAKETFTAMIKEDKELQEATRDTEPKVDLSAANDGGLTTNELNRKISESANPDKGTDHDVAMSAWGDDPNKIDDKVRKSAKDNPYDDPKKKNEPKESEGDTAFQEVMANDTIDFSRLSPVIAFRKSTALLVEGILCIGTGFSGRTKKLERIEPLMEDDNLSREDIDALASNLRMLVRTLRNPASSKNDELLG